MTLILWKAPVVDDPDEAKALLTPWYVTEDESAFTPSGDLKAVYDILLEQYPFDWDRGSDPWADPPQVSDRMLVLSIRWGTQSPVLADITALARKFDSTVYGVGAVPGSNFDNLSTAPTLTVDATGTFGDSAAVLNAIAAAGYQLTGWVVSPSLHGLLITAVDSLGRQFFTSDTNQQTVGSMFGAPVYVTRGTMPTGAGATNDKIGFAGDWQNAAVYGTVEGVQISISDQATLNDGGTPLNLWQRNMFAVRAEIEVGFRVRDVNAFISINDGTAD